MQKKCSNCGKVFEILYPELWRYKNGTGYTATEWFCRYNCMQEYRRREEEKKMARPKKDGTPARKPDRKPRVETAEKLPELPKVELVEDPEILEEYRKEQEQKNEKDKLGLSYVQKFAEEYRKEQMNKPAAEQKEPKAGTEWTDAAEVYGIAVDAEDDRPIRPQKARNVINGVEADDAQVTAIRFQGLGEFYFDSKYGTIDWRSEVGEEISLTPVDWAVLANRIPEMLKLLGADD